MEATKTKLRASLIAAVVLLAGSLGTLSALAQNGAVQISSLGTVSYPVRHVDFETSDFSQVPPGDTHGDNGLSFPTVVTDIVHSGTYAARCKLDDPSVSHASSIIMWDIPPSNPLYYSFWVYVTDGYEAGSNWNMICEWYPDTSIGASKHIDISFINFRGIKNNLYFNFHQIHTDWNVPGADPRYDSAQLYSDVEMPTGKWVFFEIYYKVHMTDGIIQAKMNGETILTWEGRTQFDNPSSDIAFAVTVYCNPASSPHSHWFDDIWIDYVSHA